MDKLLFFATAALILLFGYYLFTPPEIQGVPFLEAPKRQVERYLESPSTQRARPVGAPNHRGAALPGHTEN